MVSPSSLPIASMSDVLATLVIFVVTCRNLVLRVRADFTDLLNRDGRGSRLVILKFGNWRRCNRWRRLLPVGALEPATVQLSV
jgi:hypothetical protein